MAWAAAAVCFIAAVYFAVRYFILKSGTKEVIKSLGEILSDDTNAVITVPQSDRTVNALAAELNRRLRELRRLRRTFENGDRELKEAVTNISHDLRTPLTAIMGYLELLSREETSESVRRYLLHIENRAEAMKRLTEELFRYSVVISSADGLSPEPVDIRSVLEESIAGLYGALTERGIVPVIEIPEEKIIRTADREALSRVYGNILANALKYSDGDLFVTMDESGAAFFSNTAKNLGGVDVGRLFDRFFSVEAARNSTGLGLAISKALVEQMGGSISASMDGDRLTVVVRCQKAEDR